MDEGRVVFRGNSGECERRCDNGGLKAPSIESRVGCCDERPAGEVVGVDTDVRTLVSDSARSCSVARTSGRGSEVGRDGFGGGLSQEGCKRLNPQSFVTSHQNEYSEFTKAVNSLRLKAVISNGDQAKMASRREGGTYQSRKRVCSPCHASFLM